MKIGPGNRSMADNIEQILDKCIDRINNGEGIDACLADYPEYAQQIEPLLRAMLQTQEVYGFTPSDEALRTARQRFYTALDKQRRDSFWQRILAKRLLLATAISVIVIMVAGYLGLKATVFQQQPAVITVSAPSADGNFAFLVSDEVNALGDFSSLNVNITKVSLLQQSDSGKQVEFSPETQQFDLTLLPGDETQQLWRGNIPEGQYSDVVIYVSKVAGVLKSTGQAIDIKLPSNKLQMSKPFQVASNNITSFVYDLTVVKTGNAQNGGKYLLKPQIDTSGASHTAKPNPGKSEASPKK